MITGRFKGLGLNHDKVDMEIALEQKTRPERDAGRAQHMEVVNASIGFHEPPRKKKKRKEPVSPPVVAAAPTKKIRKKKMKKKHRISPRKSTRKIEHLDSTRILHLLRLKHNSPETDKTLHSMLKKIKKDQLTTVYKHGKNASGGRLYADGGFTTLPGYAKRLLLNRSQHEVDIHNCGPTLFVQAAIKYLSKPWVKQNMPRFREYVKKREDVIGRLCHEYGLTRNEVKSDVITAMNGGFGSIPFTKEIERESSYTTRELMLVPELRKYRSIAEKRHDESGKSLNGVFVSLLVQDIENNLLTAADEFLTGEKYIVTSLSFDGLTVQRKTVPGTLKDNREELYYADLPTELIERLQEAVSNNTSYKVKFVEKDMTPTEDDM